MANNKNINRLYSTSDASMLEYALLVHLRYTNNLADFTAYDSDLDSVLADTLLAEIQLAEGFVSDDQFVDVVADTTRNMLEQMKVCKDFFQRHLLYYVQKTFPNREEIWNEFGDNDYKRDSRNQAQFIQFMLRAYQTAQKYETELTAKNFTPALMDELRDVGLELQTLNLTQEDAKGGRKTATGQRIVLLNNVWMTVQQIRRAVKAVYYDDYAKLQLFLLPWAGGVPTNEDEITGSVAQGATIVVAVPGLQPSSVITINNLGTVPLMFCAGEVGAMPCLDGLEIAPGDSQSVTMLSLAPVGVTPNFLNVSHTIAPPGSPDGEFGVVLVS